jgi:hypothetical protein
VHVSEAPRFIYFAVPKCGTTTILHELFGRRHAAAAAPRDPEGDLDDYVKFAFVRNPWARMVSNWKMYTSQPPARAQLRSAPDRDLAELQKLERFESFVAFTAEEQNHHWQPQTLFLPEKLDFVGRLESFDDDFRRLCSLLGRTPPATTLPRRHASGSSTPYWEHYTPALVEAVAEAYSSDIEAFDYSFR